MVSGTRFIFSTPSWSAVRIPLAVAPVAPVSLGSQYSLTAIHGALSTTGTNRPCWLRTKCSFQHYSRLLPPGRHS